MGKTNKIMMYVDGLPHYQKGQMFEVNLFDDQLVCYPTGMFGAVDPDKPTVKLPYSQITNAACFNEQEIIDQNKSVVGRALVGGVLLGGLGAILGGMSGVGTKKSKQFKRYFIINYKSSKTGDIEAITFDVTNVMGIGGFVDALHDKAKIQTPDQIEL